MAWLELTKEHILARLAGDELDEIEDTGGGDGDRLGGIITQVTALVRGKVASCHKNEMGASGTIPEECLHAAASIAKHDISASLPTAMSESETSLRNTEYREAINFLNEVARCNVIISDDSGTPEGRSTGVYGSDTKLDF